MQSRKKAKASGLKLEITHSHLEYRDINKELNPHLGENPHELRLDYSTKGFSYRLTGGWAGINHSESIAMPHLRVIKNGIGEVHNDYILSIAKSGIFGRIIKRDAEKTSAPNLLDASELSYYAQETSIGLSIIRKKLEVEGKNEFMFLDKNFNSKQIITILQDISRTSSGIAVISSLVKNAQQRKEKTIDTKEVAELLDIHRLI